MNRLVVTADDFGLHEAVNAAVAEAHRDGVLSAASLMVAGPAAGEAARLARSTPSLSVGLHLTLVDANPTLPPERIPDLVGRDGRLRRDLTTLGVELAMRRSVRAQARAEIRAQFEAFHATGLPLDHVNAHRHFHLHPAVAEDVLEIGSAFGMKALRVPAEPPAVLREVEPQTTPARGYGPMVSWLRRRARGAGVATAGAVFGLAWSGAMTADRLEGLLRRLPSGLVEIYTHPAVADDFPGHAQGYRYTSERDALIAPASRRALAESGFALSGYLTRA